MNEKKGIQLGDLIRKIFDAVKRNVIVALAVVVLCVAIGGVIAYTRVPVYTASNKVAYRIVLTGSGSTSAGVAYEAAFLTESYYDTFVDFCDEGIVADRANYYYGLYKDCLKTDTDLTTEEFFNLLVEAETITVSQSDVENNTAQYQRYLELEKYRYTYAKSGEYRAKDKTAKYIKVDNVSSSKIGDLYSDMGFSICVISYSDLVKSEAMAKVPFLITAVKMEVNYAKTSEGSSIVYFGDLDVAVEDYKLKSVSQDFSKTKILIISGIIGLFMAGIAIYLITVSNHTVTDKDEVERITGVNVLSYVSNKGGA